MAKGPAKPARLPIELIAAIPAAAEAPVRKLAYRPASPRDRHRLVYRFPRDRCELRDRVLSPTAAAVFEAMKRFKSSNVSAIATGETAGAEF
jgi:hypothetical protein